MGGLTPEMGFNIHTTSGMSSDNSRVTTCVDTTATETVYKKNKEDVHTQAKKTERKSSNTNVTDTVRTAKPAAVSADSSKVALKPEKKAELGIVTTNLTSAKIQELANGESIKTVSGTFNTNLPTFDKLSIENKVSCAEASGVVICSTRELSKNQCAPTVKHFDGTPPYDLVTFSGTLQVKIPKQDNPEKALIVYNPDTVTYAFNNIEGLEILSIPSIEKRKTDADGNMITGGEKILVSGGSVAKLNTAEQDAAKSITWNDQNCNIDREEKMGKTTKGKYVRCLPQTIVLQNTKVDESITLSNDRFIAIDTDLGSVEINTSDKFLHSHVAVIDTSGEKKVNNPKNTFNLQTGFSGAQAISEWLGGDVSSLVAKQPDMKGSIKIDNEIFKNVNMENATVARTVGNLNIYNTASDGNELFVEEIDDKIVLQIPGAQVVISNNQSKDAKIYFDRISQTIVMENLTGVEVNPKDKNLGARHVNMSMRLFLNNCQVEYLSAIDTNLSNSKGVTEDVEQGLQTKSYIVLNNTDVKEMQTSYDCVYMIDNATIDNLKTTGDDIHLFGENTKIVKREWVLPSGRTIARKEYCSKIQKH